VSIKSIIPTLLGTFFSIAVFSQNVQNNSIAIVQELLASRSNNSRIESIVQLSEIREKELSAADQQTIVNKLLHWYRNEPDAGLHSAIDYLFRHSNSSPIHRTIDWQQVQELEKIDLQLQKKPARKNNWFLTAQLQTMSIIIGPATYTMGSPIKEPDRTEDELQHQVTIPRSFAICTKEVTVAQFQQFLEQNPLIKQAAKKDSSKFPSTENKKLLVFSPEPDCPQIYVTWYEATQFCNWLSKLEGIPEKEWCYPTNEEIRTGMEILKEHLDKKGYRLPTEAEWEYAARAGSSSSRYYGGSDTVLAQYAWYSKNPPQQKSDPIDPNDPHHTYPVGQLKPNLFGLFDMYGNVWEWCDSRRQPYSNVTVVDESNSNFIITDSVAMVRRGGSFSYGKDVMRSAHRGALNYFPNQRRDNVGFRIARTVR
jgi:formylglycine-generating enzyme required for sulfatase activity